ncbi:MAG: alpha/beta hydrolase [Sterolibacteriaceae bacterium]|nr:alpha/beta hydrolase [Sterolibacteriaceae bacterium]MBK9085733.1 alpha/beta hydrolase [Sterolibacteriaceae bacterium]
MSARWWPILAAAVLALDGCAATRDTAERIAVASQMQSRVLRGDPFVHQAYFRDGRDRRARELHVYIDHDGTPWLERDLVAADPTPRYPLALRLMAQDQAPSLYLGRPCHFRLESGAACNPLVWTHARYSAAVVDSMARALAGFLRDQRFDRVVLIGYSGGGTLAVLLADRLPQVASVITLAGNLDLAGWTALHGYSPLAGSLDPLERVRRTPPPREFHLLGSRDANVPPALAARYAARFPEASLIELEGFDHHCCWEAQWRSLLAGPALREAFAAPGPAR